MKPFRLTNKAKADLRQIASFTEKRWGIDQRNRYLKQFDDTFYMLADSPMTGAVCDHIKDGYRKFPQGSHMIFYKHGEQAKIDIIRILHKSMDVSTNMPVP